MKRLTERDEYGNADIVALSDVMPEIYAGLSYSETNALTEALNRLAEYEETGLTPEMVGKLLETLRLIHFNAFAIAEFIKEAEETQ